MNKWHVVFLKQTSQVIIICSKFMCTKHLILRIRISMIIL